MFNGSGPSCYIRSLTILHYTIHCTTLLYYTILYTILYTTLYYTIHYTIHYTTLYTTLYYTIHYTIYTTLHYATLYFCNVPGSPQPICSTHVSLTMCYFFACTTLSTDLVAALVLLVRLTCSYVMATQAGYINPLCRCPVSSTRSEQSAR